MALNFDDMKLAVEAVSGGENTVLFDDQGYPSIMVPINKLMNSDLITGGSSVVHPGFQVDSVEKDVTRNEYLVRMDYRAWYPPPSTLD